MGLDSRATGRVENPDVLLTGDPEDEWQTECSHGVTFAGDTPLAAAIAAEIGCRNRCQPGRRPVEPVELVDRLDAATVTVVAFHGWTR